MKLVIRHNLTEGDGFSHSNIEELDALRSTLYFKDPNAEQDRAYRDGEWDGMRDFFLDADQTIFPTGFLNHVLLGLAKKGIKPEIVDERTPVPRGTDPEPDMLHGVTLRDYQLEAVKTALKLKRGVLHMSPRSGKTEVQIAVAACLDVPSVLCVEKASLMQQHYERFLDRGVRDVGRLGSGRRELHHKHIVTTFQTLHSAIKRRDEEVLEWMQQIELAQCDEAHHLGSAITYYNAFLGFECGYRLGYSGTPFRVSEDDFHHKDFALMGVTGKRIVRVTSKFLRDEGYLVEPTVFMVKITKPSLWHLRNWQTVYKNGIVNNERRNEAIAQIAKILYKAGERTAILVRELKHGETLLKRLEQLGVPAVMSSGGNRLTTCMGGSLRVSSASVQKVKSMMDAGVLNTIIGTSIYGEGVDVPALSALVISCAGKDAIMTIQRAFRAMTVAEGKTKSYIFDFDDNFNPMLKSQSNKRVKVYQDEEITVHKTLPLSFRRALGL